EPVFAVTADGRYREDWGWPNPNQEGGQGSVINPKFNAPDGPICEALREAGALLAASADYRHSYPHSWRSKAKVIYRCTPQWFVPMDREAEGGTLREKAGKAIAQTRFVPEKGRNRIGAMVEGRPDWVLSRQRAWGVPITLFVDRRTGQYLNDPEVNARIVAAVMADGVDAWDEERAQEFLGDRYRLEDYERVTDILDVWFDSGSTHAFVLESGRWPDLQWPANLYLEGSDQHRGWFQSSLLESCATRGRAPYDAILTHGFTMDAKGMKMSKSLGNTISPIDLMRDYGADILRLWALSVDFTEDHRIGKEILAGVADQYRKLRNTYRYLLGALDGFAEDERLPVDEMPELERYMLGLLGKLDATLRQAVDDFDYNTYVRALTDFCNEDLSAFFFDIRKDCLYCDAPSDPKRRAYRTVLDVLFHALVRYGAPVLVFTAEEVWQSRYPGSESVHLLEWPAMPAATVDEERWSALRALRQRVNEDRQQQGCYQPEDRALRQHQRKAGYADSSTYGHFRHGLCRQPNAQHQSGAGQAGGAGDSKKHVVRVHEHSEGHMVGSASCVPGPQLRARALQTTLC
ncbi:MAG: class I tRNA ligase family protein, partial [Novosphingobium sp.]